MCFDTLIGAHQVTRACGADELVFTHAPTEATDFGVAWLLIVCSHLMWAVSAVQMSVFLACMPASYQSGGRAGWL